MPAEEAIEDVPGNLATDAAPGRIVPVIALGSHQKDIGHSGPCQCAPVGRSPDRVIRGWLGAHEVADEVAGGVSHRHGQSPVRPTGLV